jgi:hypothetical protein
MLVREQLRALHTDYGTKEHIMHARLIIRCGLGIIHLTSLSLHFWTNQNDIQSNFYLVLVTYA